MEKFRTFRAEVKDAPKLRQELADGTATGDVDIVVAIYDEPDTHVAVGNSRRQIIDKGAFREWVESHDFAKDPPLGFVDHGGAIETGSYSSLKMIGFASSAEETDEGLLVHTHYNLEKQIAREAYSDLVHNPAGVQFSFSWSEDITTELRDGEEHVTKIDLSEWSQVAFGAQRKAHLVAARASAARLGGVSLDALPNEVRASWWEQRESIFRALEGWAWVQEVFSTSDSEGFIVAAFEDGRFAQVPWLRMDDDSIGFDTSKAEALEQEWVPTGKTLAGSEAERAAAMSAMAPAEAMLEASKRAASARAAVVSDDPVSEFYREIHKSLANV